MNRDRAVEIGRDKVRAQARKLDVTALRVWLDRAIDMLPDEALPELIADYVHLRDVLTDENTRPDWAEWLCEELLLPVRHHQWVFTIPKRLRLFFLYDRALFGDLAPCAARSISKLYKDRAIVQGSDPEHLSPGIAMAIQTHGDYANSQPHLHALVSAGLVAGRPQRARTYRNTDLYECS